MTQTATPSKVESDNMAESQTFEDDVKKPESGDQIRPATCICMATELRMIYFFYKYKQKDNTLWSLKSQNSD